MDDMIGIIKSIGKSDGLVKQQVANKGKRNFRC